MLSTGYLQLSLAADQPNAALLQDANLNSPWGVALNSSGGDLWLANRGSGTASLYQGDVGDSAFQLSSLAVTVPGGSPTGIVANGSSDFAVHSGASSGPASFLFDSAGGDITGWNTDVPPPSPSTSAQIAATTSGAIYTGMALANTGGQNYLYAADFHDKRIDVFNSSFGRVSLAGSFTDPNLPAGYAPYNIANLGGRLLVSYALQDGSQQNPVPGVGQGIVDSFDYNGDFQKTLIAGGPSAPAGKLDEPWGMVVAPANFGDFSGDLLVANTGDGKINAFDPGTGDYLGTLGNPAGNPLTINGLHGLTFGNGVTAGDPTSLFFTGIGGGGNQGLLGEIVSAQTNPFPALGGVISPVADVSFSGVVAVFNEAPAAPAGSYTAYIDWGDGFVPSGGTVTALASGGFAVSGSRTYYSTGTKNITVTLIDSASHTITAAATANVAPPGLVFTPDSVTATEGLNFSGTLTAFTDQDGNFTNPFEYTATIDWGDGTTTTPGSVTVAGTTFQVSGTHTYATAGTEPVTVTVNDFDGATGTAHATATVVSSLSGESQTITPTETSAFNGTVAKFTDANTGRPLSDYSATIDWGDGTSSTGTISADVGGGFDVNGSHTYNDEGAETVSVAIADPGSTITVQSAAKIADLDTLTGAATAVSATEGSPFNGAVATFTDTRAGAAASGFSATIDWGDGTTTTGTVGESAGTYTVSGTHTFADEGPFTITSVVQDIGGTAQATVHSTASMADSDSFVVTPASLSTIAGNTLSGALATVSDTNLAATAAGFSASINWGDGVTDSGTVTGGNGSFTIAGTHAYASAGNYSPVVSIADNPPGTATASATAAVTVSQSAPIVTAVPVSGSERTSLTVKVATFTQPGATAGAGSYSATIAWGDGTTSQGIVSADGAGFDVSGTHVYPDEGQSTFTVTVHGLGGTSATASGTATLVEPPLADGTSGTPATRWINEVFGDLLHRAADVGALTFWSGALANGLTRADLVFAIEGSPEYRGDEVNQVYQTYLHRSADAGGREFWTGYLASNTVEDLAAIIIASPEYYQNRGGGSNDGFLDALFGDALQRPIDSGARGFFDQLLNAGVSRQQVAGMVLSSDEYLDDLVQSFYLELLDRPADAAGQGYFANVLQQGGTDQLVIAALAASDEYFAKTAR
ncbi:MAG TPA: TIGR03118 family protein [Pirellulales bacterium]|nr:TIGR03118 family protein [Pirellulales bacterium]